MSALTIEERIRAAVAARFPGTPVAFALAPVSKTGGRWIADVLVKHPDGRARFYADATGETRGDALRDLAAGLGIS